MSTTIGTLALQVPGENAEQGSRLAQLVAERLAAPLGLPPGDAAFDRLQLRVEAVPGESAEALAARIAAGIAGAVGAGR
ncbi:MAG TPA: hypothetical protein VHC67_14695 [Gaiellaceae bacterium]|nr:hypothetical protein [Gaiellaceae bacterium]